MTRISCAGRLPAAPGRRPRRPAMREGHFTLAGLPTMVDHGSEM